MQNMRNILRTACIAICLALPVTRTSAQEATPKMGNMMSDVHPMAKDVMDMKMAKEMAAPAMMQKAKDQMMMGDMMPKAIAMESTMSMAMKDDKTMKMVQEQAMAPTPDGKPIVSDEQIKAAIRKIFSDPTQFQAMLQTLIVRETTANMMKASSEKPAAEMMMIPESDLKAVKHGMMGDEAMTMMVAKEMMMNAMMMDKDISMAVKQAAMKPSEPAMQEMMKSENMMMANEKMKEPSMKMEMAKEAMARQIAKPSTMTTEKKK